MDPSGRTFVITGGGNGIGREVVLELLARGARVAAVDRDAAGLAETQGLAGVVGERLSTHVLDLADRAAVAALPDEVVAAHGTVDGVVNLAGIIQRFARVKDLDVEEIERVLNVNVWSVVLMVKAFLPLLEARPSACLVNVASMGAYTPVPGQAAYCASKAAVKLFSESLHAELAGTSVAVTTVYPGAIGTNIAVNSGAMTPEAARARAAQSSTKTTPAPEAARQIVEAIMKAPYAEFIGSDARMMDRLTRVSPQRAAALVTKRMSSLLT